MDKHTKAMIAGTQMIIAIMEKRTPEFKEDWKPAGDTEVNWPNARLQNSLLAFSHPDKSVVAILQMHTGDLGATSDGFASDLRDLEPGFLYINKV